MPGILITLDLDNHDHLDDNHEQEHDRDEGLAPYQWQKGVVQIIFEDG